MKAPGPILPITLLALAICGCSTVPDRAATVDSTAAETGTANVDPVEAAYQRIVSADDAAHDEIDKWIKENAEFQQAGAGTPKANLQAKIEQRLDELDKSYKDFLALHPNHAKAHLAYGSFLNDGRDEDLAVEHWEKARELEPGNPAPWNNLANYYGHRSPVKKAFEYYAKAIELDPTEPVYVWNLATTVYLFRPDAEEFYHLDETGVFDKALALYRQAVSLDPTNFILASDYAGSFYGTKPARYDEGLVAWEAAYKVAGDDVEREGVCLHLARCHLNLKHYDEAEAQLNRVTRPMYDSLRKRLLERIAEGRAKQTAEPAPAPAETPSPTGDTADSH